MIGESVGSYRIISQLGEGGMGAVYLAEHKLLGRRAAIKVLLPHLSTDTEVVERFFNEARAVAMLRNPALVDVFDFGYHGSGAAFIAMEALDGESLRARLKREPRPPLALALAIASQIAAAIGVVHDKGIIHRDLKPDNVFLVPDRDVRAGVRVKLLDFGIAKLAAGSLSADLTQTGAIMGTPRYMSPEQCKDAGRVDGRTDLYAIGCMLFEMVCGRPPFDGTSAGEIVGAHLYLAVPSPRELVPDLPEVVSRIIARCLAKNPDERYPTAEHLRIELDAATSSANSALPIVRSSRTDLAVAATQPSPSPLPAAPSPVPITPSSSPAAIEAVPVTVPIGAAMLGRSHRRGRVVALAGTGLVVAALPVAYIALRDSHVPAPAPRPDAAAKVGYVAAARFSAGTDDARFRTLVTAANAAADSITAGDDALLTSWPDGKVPTFDDLAGARLQGWQITGEIDPPQLDQSGPRPVVRCSVSVALVRWPIEHYPDPMLLRAVATTREEHVDTSGTADDVARAEATCVRKRAMASTAELLHWTKL